MGRLLMPKAEKHTASRKSSGSQPGTDVAKLGRKEFDEALARLQVELVKLQEWVKFKGLKIVIVFEGRDAAGKGGVSSDLPSASVPGYSGSWRSPRRLSARRPRCICSAT